MAHFEGSVKDFTRFIGAYARLKVAFIAAKYKKQIGKCEECGVTSSLDAAHIKGKGRALLIANILGEFIEDGIVRIDLYEFEEKFVQAHMPIDSTIRVLCKECHRKYDKVTKEGTLTEKKTIAEESIVIENLIQSQMNKSKAMKIAYANNLTSLTNSNTIFSNIISNLDSWWLQPHNDKFKSDLYIILNDSRLKKLYIFKLPANTITNPSWHFKQRNDRYRTNCSDIYIATSGATFQDKDSYNFSRFLIGNIDY